MKIILKDTKRINEYHVIDLKVILNQLMGYTSPGKMEWSRVSVIHIVDSAANGSNGCDDGSGDLSTTSLPDDIVIVSIVETQNKIIS